VTKKEIVKMNYFKVWWNGVQVGQDFQSKKEAERYIRRMRIEKWEIVEFNEELTLVNRWTV
jgi:hypothetical protein